MARPLIADCWGPLLTLDSYQHCPGRRCRQRRLSSLIRSLWNLPFLRLLNLYQKERGGKEINSHKVTRSYFDPKVTACLLLVRWCALAMLRGCTCTPCMWQGTPCKKALPVVPAGSLRLPPTLPPTLPVVSAGGL